MKRYIGVVGIIVQIVFSGLANAQVADFAYRIDRVEVQSEILNESHTLSVYLPPDYEEGQERYPVLYVLESIYDLQHPQAKSAITDHCRWEHVFTSNF